MNKGKFIVFEGGDKSGKTTQLLLLRDYLVGKGFDVVFTREPGGQNSVIAEKIREIILDKLHHTMHPRTELLLYLASRAQHVEEVVKPALNAGKIVLCDRFDGSTFAYQGAARHLDLAQIEIMNTWAKDKLVPDVVIYLDITPEQAELRERIEKQDRLDSEVQEFHRRVREGYLQQVKDKKHWVMINGVGKVDEIFEKIKAEINKFI